MTTQTLTLAHKPATLKAFYKQLVSLPDATALFKEMAESLMKMAESLKRDDLQDWRAFKSGPSGIFRVLKRGMQQWHRMITVLDRAQKHGGLLCVAHTLGFFLQEHLDARALIAVRSWKGLGTISSAIAALSNIQHQPKQASLAIPQEAQELGREVAQSNVTLAVSKLRQAIAKAAFRFHGCIYDDELPSFELYPKEAGQPSIEVELIGLPAPAPLMDRVAKMVNWLLASRGNRAAIEFLDYALSPSQSKPSKPTGNRSAKQMSDPLREWCEWETGFVYSMTWSKDIAGFGITKNDKLWLSLDEPKRGSLIVYSLEEDAKNLFVTRFIEWQWDEMLVIHSNGEFAHVRPATVAVVDHVGETYTTLKGKSDSKGSDSMTDAPETQPPPLEELITNLAEKDIDALRLMYCLIVLPSVERGQNATLEEMKYDLLHLDESATGDFRERIKEMTRCLTEGGQP